MASRNPHQDCPEAGKHCGTPQGWRLGGRCLHCRTAHNADTRKDRGLSQEQRSDFLTFLSQGETIEQAAARSGVTTTRLTQIARRDGELRAALDGRPPSAQKAARMGDYLAALTRCEGDMALAHLESGVGERDVTLYRNQEPSFRDAEKAVRKWLATTHTGRTWWTISTERLIAAARLLEKGASISNAEKTVGVSQGQLRRSAHRCPRLAAALPPLVTRTRSSRTPERLAILKEMWPDLNFSVGDIAAHTGLATDTVVRWAADVGLPERNRWETRRARQRSEDKTVLDREPPTP